MNQVPGGSRKEGFLQEDEEPGVWNGLSGARDVPVNLSSYPSFTSPPILTTTITLNDEFTTIQMMSTMRRWYTHTKLSCASQEEQELGIT